MDSVLVTKILIAAFFVSSQCELGWNLRDVETTEILFLKINGGVVIIIIIGNKLRLEYPKFRTVKSEIMKLILINLNKLIIGIDAFEKYVFDGAGHQNILLNCCNLCVIADTFRHMWRKILESKEKGGK